ncbi:MAG: hypothetical protein ABFD97_20275 [Syntrophobacter sp.]
MKDYIYPVKKLVLNKKVGLWCRLPYPGHPKGCPNYNKHDRCPPNARKLEYFFDMDLKLYLVHSEFDLQAHAEAMKIKHPEWTDRQCRCVLYWQSRSRKQLIDRILESIPEGQKVIFSTCPEGMGVNVFATAKLAGLTLDKTRHLKMCRHVALVQFYTTRKAKI